MQKCTNCNRPVPDGAKFCGHCGKLTGFELNQPTQAPFTQYQVTPHDAVEQPNAANAKSATAKPNCDLSVAGFVLSIFNPLLCVVAFVLSAAALAKKQVRRKLALAGLIISLIELVLVGLYVYLVYFAHVDVWQYIPFLKKQ